MQPQDVLEFWFTQLTPKQWWVKDEALDRHIESTFITLHQKAVAAELFNWRETPEGRLAEIIVIDQFSRNIFRGRSEAFLYDPLALALSQEAIRTKDDVKLTDLQRQFLYLPFMHSESPVIHERAMVLYGKIGDNYGLDFEIKHKQIIDRFGRYPHRNDVLGRVSSDEEKDFLKQPGSSF